MVVGGRAHEVLDSSAAIVSLRALRTPGRFSVRLTSPSFSAQRMVSYKDDYSGTLTRGPTSLAKSLIDWFQGSGLSMKSWAKTSVVP